MLCQSLHIQVLGALPRILLQRFNPTGGMECWCRIAVKLDNDWCQCRTTVLFFNMGSRHVEAPSVQTLNRWLCTFETSRLVLWSMKVSRPHKPHTLIYMILVWWASVRLLVSLGNLSKQGHGSYECAQLSLVFFSFYCFQGNLSQVAGCGVSENLGGHQVTCPAQVFAPCLDVLQLLQGFVVAFDWLRLTS